MYSCGAGLKRSSSLTGGTASSKPIPATGMLNLQLAHRKESASPSCIELLLSEVVDCRLACRQGSRNLVHKSRLADPQAFNSNINLPGQVKPHAAGKPETHSMAVSPPPSSQLLPRGNNAGRRRQLGQQGAHPLCTAAQHPLMPSLKRSMSENLKPTLRSNR